MENPTPPIQPENPEVILTSTETQHQSGLGKMLIPLLLVGAAVVVALGAFLFQRYYQSSKVPMTGPEIVQPTIPTQPKIMAPDATWKTYTNAEAGFSLQYPPTVLLDNGDADPTKSVLVVNAEKLADIPEDLPSFMGRKDAIAEKERLIARSGEDNVQIGSLFGHTQTRLSQFEVCSVFFTRSLTFYPGEYRVIVSLNGPETAIMDSMPEFFTVDQTNCGTNRMWKQDQTPSFTETLAAKQGQGAGQEWFDTFDAIVKTVSLTTPLTTASQSATPTVTAAGVTTVPTGWTTYKNSQYGFEINHPQDYKALTTKDDLYGYPHGIVLLYAGGQAYDVIVEIWDSKTAYESEYGPRASELKVIEKDGKFITLLDNTKSAESQEIINSFKLTP